MTPGGTAVNAKSMDDFLKKKGPLDGSSSRCFYSAYVFFEKLRIKQGKPKSKFREEMEGIWVVEGGFPTNGRGFVTCRFDERPYFDKYGRLFVV
jgi:hypothetical protein